VDSDLLLGFYPDKLLAEPLNGQIVRPDSTLDPRVRVEK
jgi:hypothetical protein